jgi:crossover junction endodeoxyribonuclease RuvC
VAKHPAAKAAAVPKLVRGRTAPTTARITATSVPPLRILGIDPGTLRLGYGIVDHLGPGRTVYVDCGVITASAAAARELRLLTIGRDLRELLAEVRPDVVAMEQAFFGKNVQATLALGEARGVALFVAQEQGALLAGYPPAQVKQIVTGQGGAAKTQVGFFVKALLGLRRVPEADAADALAIALCHARLLGARRAIANATRAASAKVRVPNHSRGEPSGSAGREPSRGARDPLRVPNSKETL